MFRYFCFLLLFLSAQLFSQTVTGIVTDEDLNAVPAVLVFNLQSEQKVYTDLEGKFSIKASVNDELRFVRQGFERESKVIQAYNFRNEISVRFIRTAVEIEVVEVSNIRLTGDLNKDSRNLTKFDKVAQLQRDIGIPGPPEKPREKAADFQKEVVRSILSLSLQPQAIYDLISGDARRMKSEYRYDDLQENIKWVTDRVSPDYFKKLGIPPDKITEFIQFSIGTKPEISAAIKAKNLSKVVFIFEETSLAFIKNLSVN